MNEKVWVLSVGEVFSGSDVIKVFSERPNIDLLNDIIPNVDCKELLIEGTTINWNIDKFSKLEEFEVESGE